MTDGQQQVGSCRAHFLRHSLSAHLGFGPVGTSLREASPRSAAELITGEDAPTSAAHCQAVLLPALPYWIVRVHNIARCRRDVGAAALLKCTFKGAAGLLGGEHSNTSSRGAEPSCLLAGSGRIVGVHHPAGLGCKGGVATSLWEGHSFSTADFLTLKDTVTL